MDEQANQVEEVLEVQEETIPTAADEGFGVEELLEKGAIAADAETAEAVPELPVAEEVAEETKEVIA